VYSFVPISTYINKEIKMSLLSIPTVDNATGEIKEIFDEIQGAFGMVPNGIRLWSASPEALKGQWANIKNRMSKDQEDQKLHTIIRYLVSGEGGCKYCVGFNGGMLMNMYGVTQDELIAMNDTPSSAPLNEKNKALLVFAMKAIKDADSITADDIALPKTLGVTEAELFDIVHAASYMLVVNTLFKTFKVQQDS
jgi:uncharacterized peroxidase-related enzyme